jgi:spermidine synthase
VGYAVLAVLTAVCAFLMWKSAPAAGTADTTLEVPAPAMPLPGAIKPAHKGHVSREKRARKEERIQSVERVSPEPMTDSVSSAPVTWLRRLRWVVLALVPSSLMLGATTYITTDIAAIPLLWVLPLALYLLSFIIVFAHISPRAQRILAILGIDALTVGCILWAPEIVERETFLWIIRIGGVGVVSCSFLILRIEGPAPLHRVMIMVMPLVVLLSIAVMLSEFPLGLMPNIVLHLVTLFVVSMVCHGELARDRPATRHLTEYFLWMSFGGVLGGLFNALVAPLAFNAILEYQVMLVAACLLLPPFGSPSDSAWPRRADLGLVGLFLLIGGFLLGMRYRDPLPDLALVPAGAWRWGVAALVLGGLLGCLAAWQGWSTGPADGPRAQGHWLDRLLDVGLPLVLGVLVLGLYWGLPARGVSPWVGQFADLVNMETDLFRTILTFSLPVLLCYTFVERSVRFGLGVGAILLVAGFSALVQDNVLHQARSFFGVLRVKVAVGYREHYRYPIHYLEHGTTTHGTQFLEEDLRDIPLNYFHRTGPIGQVFRACNTDPTRPVAVIGLGTGTLACYALKGQTLDFFDIDPVVVDLCFDTNEYFTFVEDAERRGVRVSLVLGDARLTFEPKGTKARLAPLHKRPGTVPRRRYGPDLTAGQKYNLIVVDAFSSDAIPVHLITREAVAMYRERLLPGGVLCFHISNRYLDLQPVLANIALELGLAGFHSDDDDFRPIGKMPSHWVVMARKPEHLAKVLGAERWTTDDDQLSLLGVALWPAPPGSALSAGSALSYALQRIHANLAEQTSKSDEPAGSPGWQPLDTPTELRRRLEAETDEGRQAELRRKIAANRKVGVWSDDYSNLLSVFNWR